MKIVHITPHLGGGVGKAHSALCDVDACARDHHYVLLETPRDLRFVEAVRRSGAKVSIAPERATIHELMREADLVQIEWWNHPLLFGFLTDPDLPEIRALFWCHISGIHAPFIPRELIARPERFVFTSPCSRQAPNLADLPDELWARTAVVNSGYGYGDLEPGAAPLPPKNSISYLGTVDFAKMSPALMEVMDRIDRQDVKAEIWGGVADDSPVHGAIAAMQQPHRIALRGHSDDPKAALMGTSIFLYLLQPFHFGTAENALIEAMSLGCAPLVFDNACEAAIVRDGKTGLIARSKDHAVDLLTWMLDHPEAVRRMGETARREVNQHKTPAQALSQFRDLWQSLLDQPKRQPDFISALGVTPRAWLRLLQGDENADAGEIGASPASRSSQPANAASKGSLAHFQAHYPDLDQPVAPSRCPKS